ncbi:MAG TPA: SusD/RagB family nutrient-binding outer membrane lipoprotein, partial [Pricia sp.]|nr:SusD/RagB family nutrient-binding outer membrane lipoprotein [Pricia sp.]
EGIRNGQIKADKQGKDFNSLASDMAAEYTTADTPGPPIQVITAAEVFFLRAEGALEGWTMGGSAEELYNQGIVSSHQDLGYDGTDLSGNDYVTSTNTPDSFNGTTEAVSQIPVAYDATGSAEQQLEQIITQKWIALYPNSEEAYAERRRTGYPILYDRLNSLNSKLTTDQLPRRMPYVSSEYSTNEEAVMDAINNLLGGPDDATTKLWWDAKN